MSGRGALDRIRQLVAAAAKLADARDPLGVRARERLVASTGLSPAGVDWALARCLEVEPSPAELDALSGSVPRAERAHVLLSANVFVAAHRAIALGLAASSSVEVRASRREREMAALLAEASGGGLFRLVDELLPSPGDHVWAYGNDMTLDALRSHLPAGVVLHAHGPGLGIAVLDSPLDVRGAARALAEDVVAFDQRGCLSPRVALVRGDPALGRDFAMALGEMLTDYEHTVPRGELNHQEAADEALFRDTWCYAGDLWPAGEGWVALDVRGERLVVPPVGRNVHVMTAPDLGRVLLPVARIVAAVGVTGPARLKQEIESLLPRARISPLGKMQCPRFDGPVDRRPDPGGELL
jgi:hypothetical protein